MNVRVANSTDMSSNLAANDLYDKFSAISSSLKVINATKTGRARSTNYMPRKFCVHCVLFCGPVTLACVGSDATKRISLLHEQTSYKRQNYAKWAGIWRINAMNVGRKCKSSSDKPCRLRKSYHWNDTSINSIYFVAIQSKYIEIKVLGGFKETRLFHMTELFSDFIPFEKILENIANSEFQMW